MIYCKQDVDWSTNNEIKKRRLVFMKNYALLESAEYVNMRELIEITCEKFKEKTAYSCNICGYVYEAEVLPEDYICPICKRPAKDFTKIKA